MVTVMISLFSCNIVWLLDGYSSSLKTERQHVPPQVCTYFPSHTVSHFNRIDLPLQQWFFCAEFYLYLRFKAGVLEVLKGLMFYNTTVNLKV